MSIVTHSLQHFLERIMSDTLEEHTGRLATAVEILPICDLPMT